MKMKRIKVSLTKYDIILLSLTLFLVLLRLVGILFAIVLTDSMEPTLKPGDIVVTTPSQHVKIGDIILYEKDFNGTKVLITHRIVGIKSNNTVLVTKGDNRSFKDPWGVTPSEIRGKVVLRIPYLGLLLLFVIRNRYIVFFITVIILLIVTIYDTIRLTNKYVNRILNYQSKKEQYTIMNVRKSIKVHYKRTRGDKK